MPKHVHSYNFSQSQEAKRIEHRVKSTLKGLVDWFVRPVTRTKESHTVRHSKVVVVVSLFCALNCIIYGILNVVLLHSTPSSLLLFLTSILFFGVPLVLYATGSLRVAFIAFCATNYLAVAILALIEGGFPIGTIIWILPALLLATHVVTTKEIIFWASVAFIEFCIIFLLEQFDANPIKVVELSSTMVRVIDLISVTGIVIAIVLIFIVFERILRQKNREKEEIEKALRQSQRLESVGLMAGGIAHDFNNLLTVILSYSSVLYKELDPGDSYRDDIRQIRIAGERAAALTRQLLLFSRKDVYRPEVLNLNNIIVEIIPLLQHSVNEKIALNINTTKLPQNIRADRHLLHQVLLNLTVNARDAMPKGGSITIRTDCVTIADRIQAKKLSVEPGDFASISVTDDGCGMSDEVKERIFEPFFTTKEIGKGSGLGLSTTYGIIKKVGGTVSVHSELGKGTTVTVYLPMTDEVAHVVENGIVRPSKYPKQEYTILLVEDDDAVRRATLRVLEKSGFQVLSARCGEEAVRICQRYEREIHILLTDVVMPGMVVSEMVQQAVEIRKRMSVVYISGYADDETIRHGVSQGEVAFVEKPINESRLLETLCAHLPKPQQVDISTH